MAFELYSEKLNGFAEIRTVDIPDRGNIMSKGRERVIVQSVRSGVKRSDITWARQVT